LNSQKYDRFMTTYMPLWVALLLASPLSQAQTPSASDRPTTITSSLEGNWQLTGDRARQLYPLLSGMIHADGNDIRMVGEKFATCSGSTRLGAGGTLALTGRIAPDGSFTLDQQAAHNAVQVTIGGTVPSGSAKSWQGTYTISGSTGPNCNLDQSGTFTATPLPPVSGTFSGSVRTSYSAASPARSSASGAERFTATIDQGPSLTHVLPVGGAVSYLPLTGAIGVEGSPCFKHGAAAISRYSVIEGKAVRVQFVMDDGSELSLNMSLADSTQQALLIQVAGVRGGKCDGQTFDGTLLRHPATGGVMGGVGPLVSWKRVGARAAMSGRSAPLGLGGREP
jgi:hypothetical protein